MKLTHKNYWEQVLTSHRYYEWTPAKKDKGDIVSVLDVYFIAVAILIVVN